MSKNKIKRHAIIDRATTLAAILSKAEEKTASEIIDGAVEAYKGRKSKKLFTAEETDAIMQALRFMPGYAPEKLIAAGAMLKRDKNSSYGNFGWMLYVAYIMLSITNPELFEDESDERIMKCDRCGALDNESRFVTFKVENDPSWRVNLCMECSAWLRRVLEDREEKENPND